MLYLMLMKIHWLVNYDTLVSLLKEKQDGLMRGSFLLKIDPLQTKLLATSQLSNIPVFFPGWISLFFERNPGCAINQSVAYDILAMTFHPMYLKSQNKPVFYTRDNFSGEEIALLDQLFTETGYAGIILKRKFTYMEEGTTIIEITDTELASSVIDETDIVVEAGSVKEVTDIRQEQEKRERLLKAENPVLHAALLKLTLVREELSISADNVYRYKEKSEVMEQFLIAQNMSGEAAQIQEHYNREYEALPIWYRKFGNLVKVITGKRKIN